MAKPGPKKGSGGRPRKPASAVKARSDGYKRITVGAKGKGKTVYAHRVAAGLGATKGSKGKGTVAHHKNHKRGDNRKSNVVAVSKATNNKRRKKK